MSDRPNQVDIVKAWLQEEGSESQYCDGVSYPKAPRGKERAEAMKILIESFEIAGYQMSEICGHQVAGIIKELCVPPDWRTKGYGKEITRWKNSIESEWQHQLDIFYGRDAREIVKEARKRVPRTVKKVEPEAPKAPIREYPVLDVENTEGDDTEITTISEDSIDFLDEISVKKNE